MTKQDLLDRKVTYAEYYRALAKALYIAFSPEQAKRAFASPHWEQTVRSYVDKAHAFRVFREFGDVWSTSGHICALQQAAKDALERRQEKT